MGKSNLLLAIYELSKETVKHPDRQIYNWNWDLKCHLRYKMKILMEFRMRVQFHTPLIPYLLLEPKSILRDLLTANNFQKKLAFRIAP